MSPPNDDRRRDTVLNRVFIVVGFAIQLLFGVYAYGRLTQLVDDIGHRTERIEKWIDGQRKQ